MVIPHPGYVAPLEEVDLEKDKRVFVIIDDGCNHSCHSQKWAINARRNFKAVGADLGDLEPLSRKIVYKGLGRQTVKGKRRVPFCIDFGSGLVGEGSLYSNEVANIDHSFMLLSIAAQATLGLIKFTRNRMVYMQEYGRWARLYYTTNKLWCICISDGFMLLEMEDRLPRHQLLPKRKPITNFHIETPFATSEEVGKQLGEEIDGGRFGAPVLEPDTSTYSDVRSGPKIRRGNASGEEKRMGKVR